MSQLSRFTQWYMNSCINQLFLYSIYSLNEPTLRMSKGLIIGKFFIGIVYLRIIGNIQCGKL
ncbi:MAG: hypothetical protein JWO58_1485 [Chitinophagaceae bacterium]|nr:hypothetical protein [Chitinophagaceae bacterium]